MTTSRRLLERPGADVGERVLVSHGATRPYPRRRTRVAPKSRLLTFAHNLHSSYNHHSHDNDMPDILADPSGALPAPGNDDTATAILRPKKSYVPGSLLSTMYTDAYVGPIA